MKPWWRPVAAEPLLGFLLLGLVLHLLRAGLVPDGPATMPIVVGPAQQRVLFASWQRVHGRQPDAVEREALIRQHADEQILISEARRVGLHRSDPVVRERLRRNLVFVGRAAPDLDDALVLGMDRSDPVVRRRLLQLMQHRIESQARLAPEALRDWAAAHPERFELPARYTAELRFFSIDLRGAEGACADAEKALAALRGGQEAGDDPFLLGDRIVARSAAQIRARFGPELAAAVVNAPVGSWAGPARSVYGCHLLRLVEREPASLLSGEAAARRALHGAFAEVEREHFQRELARLRERYPLVIPAAEPGSGS